MAVDFQSNLDGLYSAEFSIELCPNGAVIDLSSVKLSLDIYLMTTQGSSAVSTDAFLLGNSNVILACTPLSPVINGWARLTCASLPSAITSLNLVVRVTDPWTGTIFVDNVEFSSK